MPRERIYGTKDVDMIIAIETIIDAAIRNKVYLQTKRSIWADTFFEDIKEEIDTLVQTRLGIDSAEDLRESSIAVRTIQTDALKGLAEIKVQIETDFANQPERRKEILNKLGFTTYMAAARKRDQEALINLLYQYKTNLSPTLKTEITTKGTEAETLDSVLPYADELREANITQEGNKGIRKAVTADDVTAFNEIYRKVINIAKIASNFYKGNPAMQEQFSFNKIVKAQRGAPMAKKKETPVV